MTTSLRILLVAVLAALVGWLFLALNTGELDPGMALVADGHAATSGQSDATPAPAARAPAPERTPVQPRLLVKAADSGAPLPSASLTWLRRADATPMWSKQPDQRADAEGRIALERPAGDGWLPFVRAPGHVPQFADAVPDASGAIEVRMQPAAQLEVSVIEQRGAPVEGAAVVLTDRVLDGFGDLAATGIGHPLARHPRWQAVTDHTGRAVLDEVPPGTLVLNVLHETMFPVDTSAWNASLDLVAGRRRLVATLAEAEAVVFALPGEVEVASVDWRVDLRRLRLDPMVTQRLALVRGWLDRKFPGALVYVHKRAAGDERELPVHCTVELADGSRWRGASPLAPVRNIAAPVFLELQQEPVKTIVVRLRDPDGNEYRGVPIRINPVGDGASIAAETGRDVVVPHGAYSVGCTQFQPGVMEAFRGFHFEVGAQPPFEYCATLPGPITEVRLDLQFEGDKLRSPLSLYFRNDEGVSAVFPNWRPSRGEIRSG